MNLIIEDVIAYITRHLDQELRVEDVANRFNYSKFYFSREFKRIIGVSPVEFIMALKIERSLGPLLKKQQSILKTQLASGYLSSGTFSTLFTKNTGVSPRTYKQEMLDYFEEAKHYERNPTLVAHHQDHFSVNHPSNACQVSVSVPADFEVGLIFVGLFQRPIPNHRPVVGVALRKAQTYRFTRIPSGTYYVMTFAIKKSNNPLDYFLVAKSLRAQYSRSVSFPTNASTTILLSLREARPEDPPILFNFLKLLWEIVAKSD